MTPQDGTEQPKSKWAWLWTVLAVILAVAAISALWWWKVAGSAPAATCDARDMDLSLGETERTPNTSLIHAVVTNNGKSRCTIEGYPVVSALDSKSENYVTSVAQDNPFFERRVVTLEPRGQAHAAVAVPDANGFEKGICSDTSATLRMYLPGEVTATSVSLTTDFAHKICPGFSVTVFIAGS